MKVYLTCDHDEENSRSSTYEIAMHFNEPDYTVNRSECRFWETNTAFVIFTPEYNDEVPDEIIELCKDLDERIYDDFFDGKIYLELDLNLNSKYFKSLIPTNKVKSNIQENKQESIFSSKLESII